LWRRRKPPGIYLIMLKNYRDLATRLRLVVVAGTEGLGLPGRDFAAEPGAGRPHQIVAALGTSAGDESAVVEHETDAAVVNVVANFFDAAAARFLIGLDGVAEDTQREHS